MRRVNYIIICLFILAFSSSVSAIGYSTDRTEYYYRVASGHFLADGIEDTDLAVNGSTPNDGDSCSDYGWTDVANTATYSDTESYIGSLSMQHDAGEINKVTIANSSFTGSFGISFNDASGAGQMLMAWYDATESNDRMIGVSNGTSKTHIIYYDGGWQTSAIARTRAWTNLTVNFTSTTTVDMFVDGVLAVSGMSVGAGIIYVQINSQTGDSSYWDDFWVAKEDRPIYVPPPDNSAPALSDVNLLSTIIGREDENVTVDVNPTFYLNAEDDTEVLKVRCGNDSTLTFDTAGDSRNGTFVSGNNWTCTLASSDKLTNPFVPQTICFWALDTLGNNHTVCNTSIDVTLTGTLKGTVKDSNSINVEDALVTVKLNDTVIISYNTTTNSTGDWEINTISTAGIYTICAYKPTNETLRGDCTPFVEVS